MVDRDEVHVGMDVRSAFGTKLGKVRSIEGDVFEIEGGILLLRDRYLACLGDVDGIDVDRDEAVLAIDDDALQDRTQSWLGEVREGDPSART